MLAIDGHPIFSDGRVDLDNDRVMLNEVVERKFKGDTVTLDLLREGNKKRVAITLNTPWPYLIQARQYDVQPRFVLFAGLVFQPLSSSFYSTLQQKTVTLRYHMTLFIDKELYRRHPEVVVISKILPDPINAYLDRFVYTIVDQINETKIRTLEDVAAAFNKPAEFYVIRVMGDPQPLVLEGRAVAVAKARILRRYGVTREAHLEDSIVPPDWLANESR